MKRPMFCNVVKNEMLVGLEDDGDGVDVFVDGGCVFRFQNGNNRIQVYGYEDEEECPFCLSGGYPDFDFRGE